MDSLIFAFDEYIRDICVVYRVSVWKRVSVQPERKRASAIRRKKRKLFIEHDKTTTTIITAARRRVRKEEGKG